MTRVVFDNTDLSEFGYTFHKDIDEVPEHDYEEVTILGKNGTLLIDNKRMKNVPESYDIAITDNSTADLDRLRNFLASKVGFKRLEDDIRPDRFVMAKFEGMNSRLPSDRSKATATMNFVRKPERWLKSGETPTDASSQSNTYTGNPVEIDNPSGLSSVNSLSVALNPSQDLNGYDHPWVGGAGVNKLDTTVATVPTYAQYGLTVTFNKETSVIRVQGAYTGGKTSSFRVVQNVPNTGKTLKTFFLDSSQSSLGYVRWTSETENSLAFTGYNMVNGTTYDISLKVIAYDGNEPTEWTPYENICPIYPANGKNILPKATSTSQHGVTIEVANDGTVNMSGNPTTTSSYVLASITLKAGTAYRLSGCPTGGGSGKYGLGIYNGTWLANDFGSGATYTPTEDTEATVRLRYWYEFNLDNLKFEPMLRLSSITDASYAPYQGISVLRTGKNLLDINNTIASQNYTFTGESNDFTLTATGAYCFCRIQISCKANRPVTVHFDGSSNGDLRNVYISKTNSYINVYKIFKLTETLAEYAYTFTPEEDAFNIQFYVTAAGTTGEMHIKNLQAEYGTEPSDYEPFTGTSYPVSLGREVYGGTIDYTTGVLTVTHGIDLIDGNHAMSANGSDETTSRFILTPNPAKANGQVGFISDKFNIGTGIYVGKMSGRPNSGNIEFCLPVDVPQTAADGKAWFAENPTTICYPLAETQTINLTPQQISLLTGINYISSIDEVTVTVTEPSLLENPTLFESKPLIRVYGNGTLVINHQYITVSENPYEFIDIDCDMMDCYYDGNNANQYVSFSTNDYVVLKSGANYIAYSGTCEITPRWYEV